MKKIITILLLVFSFISIVMGQLKNEKIELKQLIITDTNLSNALAGFILHSNQLVDYYNDSLYIKIDICNYDWKVGEDCHLSDSMNIVFFVITNKRFLFNKDDIGFLIYKNHLCTVSGQYMDKLFFKSTELKIFNFVMRNSILLYTPNDDKYPSWDYLYTNNFLFLLNGEN